MNDLPEHLKSILSSAPVRKTRVREVDTVRGFWSTIDQSYQYDGETFMFEDGTEYTLDEALFMARNEPLSPRETRLLHGVKHIFDGELLSVSGRNVKARPASARPVNL